MTDVANEGIPLLSHKGPLKDKGVILARWDKDAEERLAQVRQEMKALAAYVVQIEAAPWILRLQTQRKVALQLLWRERGGQRQHFTWERIEPLLAQLPLGLAQWFWEIQEEVVILNHMEQVARYEHSTVQRVKAGRFRQVMCYEGNGPTASLDLADPKVTIPSI